MTPDAPETARAAVADALASISGDESLTADDPLGDDGSLADDTSSLVEASLRRELHAVPPHAVWEVGYADRRAVCKVRREGFPTTAAGPAVEAHVLAHVADATSVPVPEPLAVGPDAYVAAWDDDAPDPDSLTVDAARVRAMGRGLARLHEATAGAFPATGRLRVDRDVADQPGVRPDPADLAVDADRRWRDTLLAVVDDCRSVLAEFGYADVAREVSNWLRANREAVDADGVEPVLVHGNYLPDHVGLDRDGEPTVACVLDFEHALIGTPGWDYLRVAGPLFAGNGPDDSSATEAAFREAYESVRPLPAGFDERREAHRPVNGLTYLAALHVQRGPLDEHHAVARRGRRIASHVRNLLARGQ